MMDVAVRRVTAVRSRTRRAIVDAAITELARDPAVSLGQIADTAGVGRTTLHRYFAERSDLMAAVVAEADARLRAAQVRARIGEGTGREAVLRLCQEYLELGDLLTLLFTGTVPEDATGDSATSDADDELLALGARGRADGTLDPELTDDWMQGTLWGQLYLAWATLRSGDVPRHDVVRQLLRTVDKALASSGNP